MGAPSMEAAAPAAAKVSSDSVAVLDLSFKYSTLYDADAPEVLKNVTLNLAPGSRCLLLGSNGAGKTTLLTILAGKHIHPASAVQVLQRPAFHDTHPGIVSITGTWNVTCNTWTVGSYGRDVSVKAMLEGAPDKGPDFDTRVAKLMEVLDVDLTWRMHIVSDGQRRRVQLLMGLVKPWEVLLLDEVTVDLDVVARANLLRYLEEETAARGATIVYATHIFDGLERWATHIARLTNGTLKKCGGIHEFEDYSALLAAKGRSPLLKVVQTWLRAEKAEQAAATKAAAADGIATLAEPDLKLSKKTEGSDLATNRHVNRSA